MADSAPILISYEEALAEARAQERWYRDVWLPYQAARVCDALTLLLPKGYAVTFGVEETDQ